METTKHAGAIRKKIALIVVNNYDECRREKKTLPTFLIKAIANCFKMVNK